MACIPARSYSFRYGNTPHRLPVHLTSFKSHITPEQNSISSGNRKGTLKRRRNILTQVCRIDFQRGQIIQELYRRIDIARRPPPGKQGLAARLIVHKGLRPVDQRRILTLDLRHGRYTADEAKYYGKYCFETIST